MFAMLFSPEVSVYIITSYLWAKSYATTQDQFHEWFGEYYTIYNSTIKRTMDRFLNKHRIYDAPHSSRPVTGHTSEQTKEIKEQILASPPPISQMCIVVDHQYSTLCVVCIFTPTTSCAIKNRNLLIIKNTFFLPVVPKLTHSSMCVFDATVFTNDVWVLLDEHADVQNFRFWFADNPHVFM